MKIHSLALAATIIVLVAAAACTKRTAQPVLDMIAVDTLLSATDLSCNIEYRFATITNASSSPALEAIEQANINYFFGLEAFTGPVREAIRASLREIGENYLSEQPGAIEAEYEISTESEGWVVDTLFCYVIDRSSYTGGAHGMYGTECHVYSLTDGFEISLADLFDDEQLKRLDQSIRDEIYEQYGVRSDAELQAKGFFPEYITATENFTITDEGITFIYTPYVIGCYALGTVEVTLDRATLAGLGEQPAARNEKRPESHD